MSLVGSLEDLGLADILQIVSLARKSGRLLLRSGNDAGRIVLCEGAVRAAVIKGEGEDLHSLLVASGLISEDDFERASERAGRDGQPLRDAVVEVAGLARERLEALRREHVEQAIMRMFSWRDGEFSFEVREEVDPEDVELLLSNGINTQYLAMEATRLRDEGGAAEGGTGALLDLDDMPVFSGESSEPAPPIATEASYVDTVALAAARAVGEDETEPVGPSEVALPLQPTVADESPLATDRLTRPVVALDGDLNGLEWFKACASRRASRVHIFQHVDLAVERIRQYLIRGVVPVVVAAPGLLAKTPDSPLLARLRALSPDVRVLALVPVGDAAPADYDAIIERPTSLSADRELWSQHEALADQLRRTLSGLAGSASRAPAPPGAASRAALDRLREVSDRMREPSGRHDVLSLVLDYAASEFSRVAIFMIRDDTAVGMARRGFDSLATSSQPGLEELELLTSELPEPFGAALAARQGVCGPLGPRRGEVADWLGGASPEEAYVGPIESGGYLAALLYVDRLPERRPIGDTTALEVVLHEAGLALDRSALERALADSERV